MNMNIINDGFYQDETGALTKVKNGVKKAIKFSAYTAFIGIAAASALHLYNNAEDRAATSKGLGRFGSAIEAGVNDSYFKLTGHTLTEHVVRTTNAAEQATHKTVETVKEMTPTKEDGKKIVNNVQKAGSMIADDVKQVSPSIAETVKQDAEGSVQKTKTEVTHQIKQIRQYSGDLTERLAKNIKP